MCKGRFMSSTFNAIYGNLIFRFFLGLASYLLSVYIVLHYAHSMTSVKIIQLIGVYGFIYYSVFSMIDSGVKRLGAFHVRYNSANINREPIKWYLFNQNNLSRLLKAIFNLIYLFIAIASFMYLP